MYYLTNSCIKKTSISLVICATLFTSGCTLDDKVQKELAEQDAKKLEVEEIESSNADIEVLTDDDEYQIIIENNRFDEKKGNHEDSYVMTKRQEELLKKAESQTAEEAVQHNALDKAVVLTHDVPKAKESYKDRNEFARYISYVLFQYHTLQIDGKSFYQKIKPFMHPQFEEMLPSTTERREQMFTTVQKLFAEHLNSPIINYEVTEVAYNDNTREGYFYRKYTLKEGNLIFYMTSIALSEDGEWLLLDDEPAVGYEIENTHVSSFNQQFIQKEGE